MKFTNLAFVFATLGPLAGFCDQGKEQNLFTALTNGAKCTVVFNQDFLVVPKKANDLSPNVTIHFRKLFLNGHWGEATYKFARDFSIAVEAAVNGSGGIYVYADLGSPVEYLYFNNTHEGPCGYKYDFQTLGYLEELSRNRSCESFVSINCI